MKKISLLFISFLFIFMQACDKEENEQVDKYFEIENIDLTQNFRGDGETKYLTVKSNVPFHTVSSDLNWCSARFLQDASTDNLRITALRNPTLTERSAKITVKAEGFDPVEITVSQLMDPASIVVTVQEQDVTLETDLNFSLHIDANIEIDFELPDWISLKSSSNGEYKYSATSYSSKYREANIVIKAKDEAYDFGNVSILVMQYGMLSYPTKPTIPAQTAPVADLFDIVFYDKGAYNRIESICNLQLTVPRYAPPSVFVPTYNAHAASFPEKDNTKYYAISYAGNEDFKTIMKNAWTCEVYYKTTTTDGVTPVSSMQGGGFGIESIPGQYRHSWYWQVGGWKNIDYNVSPTEYVHVVATFKKNDKMALYVNGVLAGSLTGSGEHVLNTTSQFYCIGADPDANINTTSWPFKGEILFTRMYTEVLDASKAATLYNQTTQKKAITGINEIIGYLITDLPQLAKASETSPTFSTVIEEAITMGWEIINNYTVTQSVTDSYRNYVKALLAL